MSLLATVSEPTDTLPRLSLSLDTPPSSSPFPSPSSSFLPPPMPGAHEFAARPPANVTTNANVLPSGNTIPGKQDSLRYPDAQSPDSPSSASSTAEHAMTAPKDSNAPPTPSSATANKTPTISAFQLPAAVPAADEASAPEGGASAYPPTPTSNRSSLTSSRPAPPSPRRHSSSSPYNLSRASSRRQRPGSSRLSISSTCQPQPLQIGAAMIGYQDKPVPPLIQIRDFAFKSEDERHAGLGPDVPKTNRPKWMNRYRERLLRRRGSGSPLSVSSEETDEDEDSEAEEGVSDGGWGGFQWGFGRFGWGSGIAGGLPSRTHTEIARDGVECFPDDEDDEDEDGADGVDLEGGDEDDLRHDNGDGTDAQEPVLYPGLYRALYAFEPEGTAEMRLEEDQVVRVLGRGGGVGWAVVIREGEGEDGHALVPESYLEVLQLDDETT